MCILHHPLSRQQQGDVQAGPMLLRGDRMLEVLLQRGRHHTGLLSVLLLPEQAGNKGLSTAPMLPARRLHEQHRSLGPCRRHTWLLVAS